MTKGEYLVLAGNGFRLPSGDYAGAFLGALEDLASVDPELRDDLAFSACWTWVLRGDIATSVLRSVVGELCSARFLFARLDSASEELAVRRTFAALLVSTIVEYDNRASFLSAAELEAVLTAILDYQSREPCEVGYSDRVGWVHALAHCADAFRELLKSPKLAGAQRRQISRAIVDRLVRAKTVLGYGEDERYAQAIFSAGATEPEILEEHIELACEVLRPNNPLGIVPARNLTQYTKTLLVFSQLAHRPDLVDRCGSALAGRLPSKWKENA